MRADVQIEIIYQDASLVIASKPGGLLCHRSIESRDHTFLLQTLRNQLGQHVFPVHRLDRGTSGAMAFALSSEDARLLQESLTSSEARKEYLALVRGSTAERWECDRPLTSDSGDPKPAHSIFEKIAEFSGLTLLRARILTGRRHQIRRHLGHAAHQVLGDSTYGKGRINRYFRETYGLPRMFLHAAVLSFRHPRTSDLMVARASLPGDLRDFLLRLPDVPPGLIDSL